MKEKKIKGWTPSFIELLLSQPIDTEEPEPPAIDADLQQLESLHDAVMEIKRNINNKKEQ